MDILEMKNTIREIKSSMDGFKRLVRAEERTVNQKVGQYL